MAKTPSTMLALGTQAPNFELKATDQNSYTLESFQDKQLLLVMFICNHCPFVVHIREKLASITKEFQAKGVAVVAINSNDVENYPEDSPEKMLEEVKSASYSFPYLYDEDQSVAKAYKAACTPDFFLFDSNRKLIYRGQFDSSRPSNKFPVDGQDIQHAIRLGLENKQIPEFEQKASLGCNIKWKPGNEPNWAP